MVGIRTVSKIAKGNKVITWLMFGFVAFVLLSFYTKLFGKSHVKRPKQGSKLSETEAQGIADDLWIAVKDPGTFENAIYDALSGLDQPSYNHVYNKFGLVYYDDVLGVEGGHFFNKERDLSFILKNELTYEEIEVLTGLMLGVTL